MATGDIISMAAAYLGRLPSDALQGDVFAISAVLIIFYLAVYVINKFTEVIILVLKKILLLIIVSAAFYQFILFLNTKITFEGLTQENLILGGAGLIAGFIAFLVALSTAFRSIKEHRNKSAVEKTKKQEELEELPESERKEKETLAQKIFSPSEIKDDKKLGAAIAYLIVAEFGVISSKTVPAPNETVGLIFFLAFILAAFYFIRQTYASYSTGLRHFFAVFLIGFILSVILGYFWNSYTLQELLSPAYFATDSLVAFVTGIAISLFMAK